MGPTQVDSRAETLPYSWYADPAVARAEHERIFRRSWQYVGHTGELDGPGSMFPTQLAGMPVVVVLDGDGELRAFLNVCRHRGSLVCEGEGRRETLQCPYHAWTYELDGSLRSAPRADREPGLDPAELGLMPVAVDTWGPFVFVNPDASAAPLAETLGELPGLVADAGIDVDALRFLRRTTSDVAANWKVCAENYLECYHCQVAHPGFTKVVDVSPEAYRLEEDRFVSSQYGPVKHAWSGAFDPGGEIARGQFHFVWPNLTINVMPGHANLSLGPIVPVDPERTTRFLDYFVGPDVDDAWVEELLAFDDQVGAEDVVLVERVQRGVRSGALEHGHLLAESERLIAHFGRLLVDALG
jgi:phenylpropionate dioxygenase-like ring-hydroxylating dioxygenase large terminal subunit